MSHRFSRASTAAKRTRDESSWKAPHLEASVSTESDRRAGNSTWPCEFNGPTACKMSPKTAVDSARSRIGHARADRS